MRETQTSKTLAEEIKENVRRDRKKLEYLQEKLLQAMENPSDEETIPAHVAAACAEGVARLADSLTRANGQLVELVKIDAKNDPKKGVGGLTENERENIYSSIENGTETAGDA